MTVRTTLTSFIAGFYAVLCFHQLALGLLYWLSLAPVAPFNMAATRPFGIPAVISASIWGGIWGVLFAYAFFQRLRGAAYWIVSVLAGAVLLSLVAAIIVSPMKGQGIMWGMDYSRMYMALCVNGCWGLGCAWFYKMMNAR